MAAGLNVIMLGPPGAGKGTQAERLARAHSLPKISTGDMLREAVRASTLVGAQAKAIMDRGELVNDDLMVEIVSQRLNRPDVVTGFILDGFPRTVAQAKALDAFIAPRGALIVLNLDVRDELLMNRLTSRLICSACGANADPPGDGESREPKTRCARCGGMLARRSDDEVAVIAERLKLYHRESEPLLEYYRKRSTFFAVDGAQPASEVTNALSAAIEGCRSFIRSA